MALLGEGRASVLREIGDQVIEQGPEPPGDLVLSRAEGTDLVERVHDSLTLPRLRARWTGGQGEAAERSGAFRISAPERTEIYRHAARQAAVAAEHLRRCAVGDPGRGADAAWAAADALHAAARVTGSRVLRCAADEYDRAARAPPDPAPHPGRGWVADRRAAACEERRRQCGPGPRRFCALGVVIAATSTRRFAVALTEERK